MVIFTRFNQVFSLRYFEFFQNGREMFDYFPLRTHNSYETGLGDFPFIIKQQLKQSEDDWITLDPLMFQLSSHRN